jgi:hypothetical protein
MTNGLDDLLDQVRDAVLTGDLVRLAGLAPRVEAAAVSQPRPDLATAARLKAKADRNAALLTAAGKGIRAAEARLRDILGGPKLTTYDSRGRKADLAVPSAVLPRRA